MIVWGMGAVGCELFCVAQKNMGEKDASCFAGALCNVYIPNGRVL